MDIKNWIQRNIPANSTIVEAGTADGNDTVFFSDHCNRGFVYGFEPDPNLFAETQSKILNRNNVQVENIALSDKTGTATFYISDRFGKDWGSSSLLKPKDHIFVHPQITFKKEITVNTINLDEWFIAKRPSIETVDLMWLDMQGAEPFVLKNAPGILSKTKYLFTEVSLIETYENVEQYSTFKQFLHGAGFDVISEDLPWKDMGNVLFKNRNIA
uniref:Methyltransferase FkbM domain-containing protein n=1 Tax=viral metagenome TaxID=1070528 RepID=A0A6C0K2H5_9ZZZZ